MLVGLLERQMNMYLAFLLLERLANVLFHTGSVSSIRPKPAGVPPTHLDGAIEVPKLRTSRAATSVYQFATKDSKFWLMPLPFATSEGAGSCGPKLITASLKSIPAWDWCKVVSCSWPLRLDNAIGGLSCKVDE